MALHVHFHDSSNNQYAREMAAAARAEHAKAIQHSAKMIVIFGGKDPIALKALEEVQRHSDNIILWDRVSKLNHQVIGRMLRSREIPSSAYGYNVRLSTSDARFTATYSASLKSGKKVSFTATVLGKDQYEAGDKLKALAEKRFGPDLYYPVIKFNRGGGKLDPNSVSLRVAKGAGPEEE